MSTTFYQRPQGPRWEQARGLCGTIAVELVVRAAWRRANADFLRRCERLEEREALRWWHRAELPAERAVVERLYGPALARWRERCKAAHGDAERFGAQTGGEAHV